MQTDFHRSDEITVIEKKQAEISRNLNHGCVGGVLGVASGDRVSMALLENRSGLPARLTWSAHADD
jgi:hypothetical protein